MLGGLLLLTVAVWPLAEAHSRAVAGLVRPPAVADHRAADRSPTAARTLPGGRGPRAVVDPALRRELAHAGERHIPVIVHLALPEKSEPAASSGNALTSLQARPLAFARYAQPLLAYLERERQAGRIGRVTSLWLANAVAVTVAPAALPDLAAAPGVRFLALDGSLHLEPWQSLGADPGRAAESPPPWNIRAVRADEVWRLFGIDGSGVTIAVLDTGVDVHHPSLRTRYRGYLSGGFRNRGNWWCRPEDPLCGFGNAYPVDSIGHGTHVAGTAVGGDGIGVAPGAHWIAARVCADVTCQVSWIIEGLQWLLAPGGASDLRPDIVNLSLGNEDSDGSLVLKNSIDALTAAGIVVVASAGNRAGTVTEPASYPNVIAVGAVDSSLRRWPQSGYGSTLWQQNKPELMAPGVAITSAIPGGGLGVKTGTSMAAPHVSGVIALLKQAKPDLTPATVAVILKRTATAVGPIQPNAQSGWGLVNAYAAVATVGEVGFVRGRVTRLDGTAIPWARIGLHELGGGALATVEVDEDGKYELAVRPGVYSLTAEAFAFGPRTERPVTVQKDETSQVDFVLEPLPSVGQFAGWVYARRGSQRIPMAARLELLNVPSEFALRSNPDTGFSAQLPAGRYTVRIRELGYRILTDTVTITAGATITRSYELDPAPRILLVDGDAWLYRPAIDRFRQALDRTGYPFDEWPVIDDSAGPGADGGPPRLEDLQRYDIVVWSHHTSSPGTVNAAEVLDKYLAAGGRLFLTGQDILCLDGGSDAGSDACNRQPQQHPYVERRLRSRVVRDNSGSLTIMGTPSGLLSGLRLTLNGPDSADNQVAPDVLRPLDPLAAAPIATYEGGGDAGMQVGPCAAGRAVIFGFGFEGIAGARLRDQVMARVIEGLWRAEPPNRLRLRADLDRRSADVGRTLSFTVTLRNVSTLSATVDIRLANHAWPWTLWQAGFDKPLGEPLTLGGCAQVDFGVRTRVPDVPRGALDHATVVASDGRASSAVSLTLTASRLAPLLLVDGDFFYQSEDRYVAGLRRLGLAYDHWELGLLRHAPDIPSAADLAAYPAVIWFTGYDWRPDGSLNLDGQRALATYLGAGGRLLFSSEDYLLIRATTPYTADRLFHADFLGVAGYAIDDGQAHQGPLRGAKESILAGLDGCRLPLRSPRDDLSDALVPRPEARPALLDGAGQAVGLEVAVPPFKSLFLALDLGLMDSECSAEIIRRAVDWFSPMHPSSLQVADGRLVLAGGDDVRLDLKLCNEGRQVASGVAVHWDLPPSTTVTAPPADWDFLPPRTLRWTGSLAASERRLVTTELRLADDVPPNSHLQTSVAITDPQGLPLRRSLSLRANAPDLAPSHKAVHTGQSPPAFGELATFTIVVRNSGTRIASAVAVTDWLPSGLRLVPQSVHVDSGEAAVGADGRSLVWHTSVAPGRVAAVSYDARVVTSAGGRLRNVALVRDESGTEVWLSSELAAQARLPLPCLLVGSAPGR